MEKSLGLDHPYIADSLNNLALLYIHKGDNAQALQFLIRGNEIQEHNLKRNLATSSERQKQLYLNTLSGEIDAVVSLHRRSTPQDGLATQLALTMILQRKGHVLDAMADQLATLRRHATPQAQGLLNRWALASKVKDEPRH